MNRSELEYNVLEWAAAKDLLHHKNHIKQTLKTLSEAGELADAIAKNDREEIIDAIGDIEVCLIILKQQLSLEQNVPLQSAYDVIKHRTGKTVNGNFIKD